MRDDETCAVCGRSILAGERTHTFLSPKHGERLVCELCRPRAERRGWLDEPSARDALEEPDEPEVTVTTEEEDLPVSAEQDPPLAEEDDDLPLPEPSPGVDFAPPVHEREDRWADPAAPGATVGRAPDPEADESPQMRLERAAARFNGSEASRTVGGLMRTLGDPWVSIGSAAGSPSQVRITVAWELGWYQWEVDLDEAGSIRQLDKGKEIDELDGPARQWNATAAPGGQLALGVRNGRPLDHETVG